MKLIMNCQQNHKHQSRSHSRGHRRAAAGMCAVAFAAIPTVVNAAPVPELDAQTQQTMIDAINDEYHAHAVYSAVIEKFGEVRPFANIVHSEARHIDLWKALFTKYGLPIPPDTFAGNVNAPDTIQAACEAGVAGEIVNVSMYDRFLSFVKQADLRAAFTQLRHVSQNNHLRAFQRCANR
jgi:hypothetical protein